MIQASVFFGSIDLKNISELSDSVFRGYYMGLDDAGWDYDPDLVYLGYAASSIRYIFAGIGAILRLVLNEDLHSYAYSRFGCPIEEWVIREGHVKEYFHYLSLDTVKIVEKFNGLL